MSADRAAAARSTDSTDWLIPLVVVAATLVAFAPTLQNGFVNWDDTPLFLENLNYRGLGPDNLRWMFTAMPLGHWAPLTWLTHAVDYTLWGMNPSGHHFSSMIVHAGTAFVFYLVSLRLLRLALPEKDPGSLRIGAGVAALFFAIHPLRVESVAWVTERRDLVSGFFFLLTILAYIESAVGDTQGRRRWLVASVCFYALAVLSKTIVMTLPVILLLLDFYPLRRIGQRWRGAAASSSAPREAQRGAGVWIEKIPFVLLGGFAAAMALYGQREFALSLEARPVAERIAAAVYGTWFYIWKTAAPYAISPLYELRHGMTLVTPIIAAAGVALIAITAGLILLRRRWPAGLVVWLSYLVLLAPVSGLAQTGPQLVASRYSYLSCLGFALLLGGGASMLVARYRSGDFARSWAGAVAAGSVAAVIALVILTRAQAGVWRNGETLWRHAISLDQGSAIAHSNLGALLADEGRFDEAEPHIRRALELRPGWNDPVRNLATLALRGNLDEAAKTDIGMALARQGDFDRALAVFGSQRDTDPRNATVRNNIGVVLYLKGDYRSAIEQFQEALSLDPRFDEARNNLAAARAKL